MANEEYMVASPEGSTFAAVDEGETVELDLDAETKRAVVAAGWLEPTDGKGAKGGKG